MSDVEILEKRNIREYGNPIGPSTQDVLKNYEDVESALEAATRSSKLFDALFFVF